MLRESVGALLWGSVFLDAVAGISRPERQYNSICKLVLLWPFECMEFDLRNLKNNYKHMSALPFPDFVRRRAVGESRSDQVDIDMSVCLRSSIAFGFNAVTILILINPGHNMTKNRLNHALQIKLITRRTTFLSRPLRKEETPSFSSPETR